MNKLTILIVLFGISFSSKSQILEPVHWSYAEKKLSNGEALLFIKATIDDGWHIYSSKQKPGGPVKTSFKFEKSNGYKIISAVSEPAPISKFDKTFNIQVNYFESSVIFQQKVHLNSSKLVVKGKLNFMVCNNQKCLPPEDVNFEIPIK